MKYLISFLMIAILVSCHKTIEGCMDSTASNFNEEANDPDNSCEWIATVEFYHNESTASTLNSGNPSTEWLSYYIDGQLMHVVYPGSFNGFEETTDCESISGLVITRDIGVATLAIPYEVKDENEIIVWSGSAQYVSGNCVTWQLSF
jgi:hypothetical protein